MTDDDSDNRGTDSEDPTRTAHEPVGAALPQLLAPQRLAAPLQQRDPDRYEHVAEHGRGGLGIVNRAHDKELGRDVAIKELLSRGDLGEIRFLREAMITARLEHPGIVPIHEAGRWPDGTPFYVMKLVAGRSLKELLAERQTIKERLELLHHVIAVADAVAYAHKRRIIHRDLKASNVIAGDYGETVVIDWGLAKDLSAADLAVPSDAPFRAAPSGELTEVGRVLGTPDYMAPEQLRGEAVDQRADVYAIGVMLWQLCSLDRIPPGEPHQRARQLRRSGIDRDLTTIIQKALAAAPADRYQGAGELAEDLRAFKSGARIAARQYSLLALLSHWTRRHRALALTISAALVIALTGTAIFIANIAAARDRADTARANSEVQQQRAEAANNELVLQNAALLMLRDPTAALAVLATYRGTDQTRFKMLRAEAIGRGVAEVEITPHSDTIWFVTGDANGTIYSIGEDRRIRATKDGVSRTIADDVATRVLYAYAPQKQWLAYARAPSGVAVLELETHRRLAALDMATPVAMALSADGSRIATLDARGELEVRQLPSGDRVLRRQIAQGVNLLFVDPGRLLVREKGAVRAVSVGAPEHPDVTAELSLDIMDARRDAVIVGDGAGRITLLRPDLTRTTATLSACRARVNSVQLASRANLATFACQDGTAGVARYDAALESLRIVATFELAAAAFESSFDAEDSVVVVTSASAVIHVYDLKTRLLSRFEGHRNRISATHAPDARCPRLLSADVDGTIRSWRLSARHARSILRAPGAIYGADFVAGANLVVAYGAADVLYRIRLAEDTHTVFDGHDGATFHARIAPDGAGFLTLGNDKTILLWSTDQLAPVHAFTHHRGSIEDAEYISSSHMASVDDQGKLLRWSPLDPASTALFTYRAPLDALESIPHNHHLVTSASDGTLWDLSPEGASKQVRAPDHRLITALRASADGRALAVGFDTGEVVVYETEAYEVRHRASADRAIRQLAFDPRQRDLLILSEAGDVQRLPLDTRRTMPWSHLRMSAREAAYSHDGDLIAFACTDGSTWFYSTREDSWAYARDHSVSTSSGRFASRGAAFVSTDRDGMVIVRDVDSTFRRTP